MDNLFEKRRALEELSDTTEKMRYLLKYLETAVYVSSREDLDAMPMLVKVYGNVTEARALLLEAEQHVDKYFQEFITKETDGPIEAETEVF